jgi:phosphoribosylformylglycinamidine synthase
VWLDRVLLRDPTLSPEEILMSESQERMCAVVEPAKVEAFLAICAKWDVEAVVIGEVNASGRLTVDWHGEQIVDVPPRTVAHEGPVYDRPLARPEWLTPRQDDAPTPERLARPGTAAEIRETLLTLFASPNLAAKNWVTDQYDRYVMGNTVLAQPEDSGMIRIDDETGLGVALATDCNGRFAALDPYAGAQLAFAEAYRNVSVSGAVPLAITNCLNFGSPEDPGVMWQFAQAVTGLADACLTMGTPVTGGNVSFYNQTGDVAIHPTPVVGVLGVIDDVARRTPMAWGPDGDLIYVLGDTRDEFGGSEWAHVVHNHLGGMPPHLDLEAERQLGQILVAGSRDGMLTAAHDVSDGGLAVALVEMALRADVGARCWVPDGLDPFVFLLSESATRAVVVVARSEELRFTEMCAARGFPATRIGVVDSGIGAESGVAGGQALVVDGVHGETVVLPLAEVRELREATLPALFG